MTTTKLSVLTAAIMIVVAASVKAQTADDIISKHIDAIGGTDNWNKITSVKKVGSMSAQGMDIGVTQTTVNNKGARTDIRVSGMSGYMIVTPKEGWMYLPFQGMDKVTPMPPETLKIQQDRMNVKGGMLADRSDIVKAEYIGKDTVNNISCLKLKIKEKDGNEEIAFFDAATYYIIREERTMMIKDEEQEVDVNFSNFQKQPEGIVVPMSVTSPMMGGDITFKSIEINKPLDDNIFQPNIGDKK